MLGVSLSFYKEPLKRVAVHLNKKPIETLDMDSIVTNKEELIDEYIGEHPLKERAYNIPLRFYKKPSLDHICKIRHSSFIMMDSSIENLFEKNLNYSLVRKITSSMWRWGCNKGRWNDIVDAYDCIRGFKFEREDFTLRLDYTRYPNEKGRSEYTRTYLDGSLAYLFYYKGKHVLTVGFSVMANRRILIQQVQLKQAKGNRWLFKFPKNYLEYIIDLFYENFPRYRLYIVDGEHSANSYLKEYQHYLDKAEEDIIKASIYKLYDTAIKERDAYKVKVKEATANVPRLREFYANTGRYEKHKKPLILNRAKFYRLDLKGESL